MKKKLLTFLLVGVLAFGVFGFSACGDKKNPANDYNYFSSVYDSLKTEQASDIRLKQLTYNGIYNMFQTPGNFLVYWGGYYDETAKANIKAANTAAQKYNVTIYNFDPNLDAKIGNKDGETVYNTASADLSDPGIGDTSAAMAELRVKLVEVMNEVDFPEQGTLSLVSGATRTLAIVNDNVEVSYKGIIKNMTKDKAKFETIIQNGCVKVPSHLKYKNEDGTFSAAAFDSSTINTFDLFNDYRLHIAGDYATAQSAFTGEATVFESVTYHGFLDLLTKSKGMYAVLFGGTWCPNTQALAESTNKLAKEYGIDKIYSYDPRLDDGTTEDTFEVVNPIPGSVKYDPVTGLVTPVTEKEIKVYPNTTASNSANYIASSLNTRNSEDTSVASRNYAHLYARLIDTCLPDFFSQVNEGVIGIKGEKISYTLMCVPSIMLFNGDLAQKDKVVDFAEAEYIYGYAPHMIQWEKALHSIFSQNKFASYVPPVEETEGTTDEGTAGGSTGGGSVVAPPPQGGTC